MSGFQVCDYEHDHPVGDPSFDDCQAAAADTRARLAEEARHAEMVEIGRALAEKIHTRSDFRRCDRHARNEHFTDACPVCGRTRQSWFAHRPCMDVQDPITFEPLCERDRAQLRRRRR